MSGEITNKDLQIIILEVIDELLKKERPNIIQEAQKRLKERHDKKLPIVP